MLRMIDHEQLQRLAAELGVRITGPLAGGEFGALLATDASGRELVLKTMPASTLLPAATLAAIFARGAALAGRLRQNGYPAPEYLGTGAYDTFAWSLQERLPGAVPDAMAPAHARRLLELARLHRDAAGEPGDLRAFALARVDEHMTTVVGDGRAAPLAREIAAAVDRWQSVELRQHDVVHSDFHHRNYLAAGDEVTGVFDWEFARAGDWRLDLVTMTFWAALGNLIPDSAAGIIVEAAVAECPAPVLAFLASFQALRQLDFDVRTHPDRVEPLVAAINARIAPWWRSP
jgi:aminoglycoside phosphotransferase (APT) family kinase protein